MKRFFKPVIKPRNDGAETSPSKKILKQMGSKELNLNIINLTSISSDVSDISKKKIGNDLPTSGSVKYIQKYKKEWEEVFPWLKEEKGIAFCKLCSTSLANNRTNLMRHEKENRKHLHLEKEAKSIQKIDDSLTKIFNERYESKIRSELICTMFCIKNNLPLSLMDNIPALLKVACIDSNIAKEIKCGRSKATALINDVIGPFSLENLSKKLQNSKFSLILDESTDVGTQKNLVIVARFYDISSSVIADKFLGLLTLENSSAKGIFEALINFLRESKIPTNNIIGLSTDNASVMSGKIGGVQKLLKETVPNLFYIGCTCHNLQLCSQSAAKELPLEIEKFLKNVYAHFSHSAKRLDDLRHIQEAFNIDNHKILRVCLTRWLCYEAVVQRVLEQWSALIHYFTLFCFEEPNATTARDILEYLNKPYNKLYLLFLEYILRKINYLNEIFQSEKTKIYLLREKIVNLLIEIMKNFILTEYLDLHVDIENENHHLPLSRAYFGFKFEEHVQKENIGGESLTQIKRILVKFYIKICKELRKKFDVDDKKMNLLRYINPKIICDGEMPTILELVSSFPYNKISCEVLNEQWRYLIGRKDIIDKYFDDDVVTFWRNLANVKNNLEEVAVKELADYIITLCCLPHSSAAAERKFSSVNLIKTDIRNKLNVKTLHNILLAKELDNEYDDKIWVPSKDLLNFVKNFKFHAGNYKSRLESIE